MDQSNSPIVAASFDRRGLFRIGGLTIAGAAIVAACADTEAGELGRVGVGQPTPELEDGTVDNGTLLRTAASVEISIAAAYARMLESGVLTGSSPTFPDLGDQTELVTRYAEHHTAAAAVLNGLAVEVGAEPWECGNPRLDEVYIDPVFVRVFDGAPATSNAPAIPPSDDPLRDMINLVETLELLSAATSQAYVPELTDPAYRATIMEVGVTSARQAAHVALVINPGGYLPASAAAADAQAADTTTTAPADTTDTTASADGGEEPPQTEIPLPVALPAPFGQLGAIVYIGGSGDENGVRLKLLFEWPSLNSMVYSFDSCDA